MFSACLEIHFHFTFHYSHLVEFSAEIQLILTWFWLIFSWFSFDFGWFEIDITWFLLYLLLDFLNNFGSDVTNDTPVTLRPINEIGEHE